MFEYELPIAVTTLDRKELLPAGTFLTEQVVADVRVSSDVRGPPVGNCYGLIVDDDEKVIPDQGLNSVRSSS
jgi:hypothetical protein